MARMKTFRMWVLIIIGFYIYSTVITHIMLKDTYKNINGDVTINSPIIEILEAKSGKNSGNIKGIITNDTDEKIEKKYIKIDFYSKLDTKSGTEYIEISNLNENEQREFSKDFSLKNVEKYEVSFVDEIIEDKNTDEKKYVFNLNNIAEKFIEQVNGISRIYQKDNIK